MEDLPDVQQGEQGTQSGGKNAAQQQLAQLIHRAVTAGELTGGELPEEVCRHVHEAHHQGRLGGERGFELHPIHHQPFDNTDHLRGDDRRNHEHGRPHQKRQVSALQHEAGQRARDIGHQQAEQDRQQRQTDHRNIVARIQAVL